MVQHFECEAPLAAHSFHAGGSEFASLERPTPAAAGQATATQCQWNAEKFYILGASAPLAWHRIGTLLRVCRPCCGVAGIFVMAITGEKLQLSGMRARDGGNVYNSG